MRNSWFRFCLERFRSESRVISFCRFSPTFSLASFSLISLTGSRGSSARVSFLKKQFAGRFCSNSRILAACTTMDSRFGFFGGARFERVLGGAGDGSGGAPFCADCSGSGSFCSFCCAGCWLTATGGGRALISVLLMVCLSGLNLESDLAPPGQPTHVRQLVDRALAHERALVEGPGAPVRVDRGRKPRLAQPRRVELLSPVNGPVRRVGLPGRRPAPVRRVV